MRVATVVRAIVAVGVSSIGDATVVVAALAARVVAILNAVIGNCDLYKHNH